jgi:hypothetical protein
MALRFFGSLTFTAYSMPLRMLPVFGSLNIGAYLLAYAVAGSTRPGFVPVEIAGMPATGDGTHPAASSSRPPVPPAARDGAHRLSEPAWLRERLARLLAGTGARPTLLVLDLDGFKEINDRQGHAAGDDVLIKTTRAIREILGDDVVIGRLGGDEFAAVLAPASSGEYGLSALITTLEEQLGERRGGERGGPG